MKDVDRFIAKYVPAGAAEFGLDEKRLAEWARRDWEVSTVREYAWGFFCYRIMDNMYGEATMLVVALYVLPGSRTFKNMSQIFDIFCDVAKASGACYIETGSFVNAKYNRLLARMGWEARIFRRKTDG
ncbi:MAG: hypothetical protein LBO78_02000 [Rickettsiales bacterium]|jgi:hypothetical protein|nr:hypothetical protein [Rickettsiales bacterium]